MKHLWLLGAALIPLSLGWLLWSGVPVRALLGGWTLPILGVTVVLLVWAEVDRRKHPPA